MADAAAVRPAGRREVFAPLRQRNFRLLWTGLLVSNTGSWMQFTALGYLVDQITKEPIYLGLLGLSQAVPRLLFAFLGGVAADRFDRRRMLLWTNCATMISAVLLGLLAISGRIQVWQILAIGAFNSLANSFDMPARQSLVPSLVGERQLMQAVGLNTMAFNGSGIFGPSLAGVLIATVGVAGCFFANAASYLAVLTALWLMDVPPAKAGRQESVGEDIRQGIGLLVRHRHLMAILGIVAAINFFGRPYIRLMPTLAREVLRVGPSGLGLLQAAPGVGTILAVFLLGAIGEAAQKGKLLVGAAMATGAMVVLFALSPWFAASMGLLVLVGTGQAVAMAAANTLLQTSVAPDQRGRIMGLYGMVTFGMLSLGTLPLGALAGVVGVPLTLALGGAVVVVLVGLLAIASPGIAGL